MGIYRGTETQVNVRPDADVDLLSRPRFTNPRTSNVNIFLSIAKLSDIATSYGLILLLALVDRLNPECTCIMWSVLLLL